VRSRCEQCGGKVVEERKVKRRKVERKEKKKIGGKNGK
jgi:hypothetical protein